MQEGDQSWIYGVYQCRAENIVGGREELKELDVTLKRARKYIVTVMHRIEQG